MVFFVAHFSPKPTDDTKAVHGDVSALSPGGVRVGAPVRDLGVFFWYLHIP